ncbi:hypothetical protein [Arsenicicoccus dermatophilus]|uniref:hypothetical protein n=1 Tax=Arsenicicoccus dermatophilus TaxID=1076331 RepID=UPI0039174D7E
MTARARATTALDQLLATQDAVVSRSQLLALGLPDTTVRRLTSRWQHVFPGVYAAVPTARRLSFDQRIRAGLLHGGPGARLRGATAGRLQGLVDEEPATVEVLVPWTTLPRARCPGIRVVRERPGVRLASLPGQTPTTRIEDTVLDLCDEGGERACLTWLSRACQRRLTTADRILERARGRRRVRHRALTKDLLLDVAAGVHSHLEKRWVDDVERGHGLPTLARQWVVPETGHPADGAHLATRSLLELDGRAFHAGEAGFRDLALDARHLAAGYGTFRADWAAVTVDPCRTARLWAACLANRGWAGAVRACPRCA